MAMLKTIENEVLETTSRSIIPPLLETMHKGQAGRIGIIGGSLEYTGAPFFAAISGLKVGADVVHIFCTKESGAVIKTYSPEVIVHPLLDDSKAVENIESWMDNLHIMVIGPGLGRDPKIFATVEKIICLFRERKKPLVIDADGLFLISQKPDIIKNYPGVILTPNKVEYERIFKAGKEDTIEQASIERLFGTNCVVVRKGKTDEIFNFNSKAVCSTKGSSRRCGGQGDLLAGSLAVFYNWALMHSSSTNHVFSACYAACKLTRKCNARAFKRKGRSMTTTDMITEIGSVFNDHFDNI